MNTTFLKKFHWVLFKNDEILLDPNKKKRYNRRLRRYLNYHDIKCLLQDSHPQLEMAIVELEELISRYRECILIEFSSFASTLNKWKEEIVNSFRVYTELDKKTMSNALIENRNKIIKNVKWTSNGYTNWRRFRNRLMYTLDQNSTYSLHADESMIEAKRKKNQNNYLTWKEHHHKVQKRS